MKFDSNLAWKQASAAIAANREVLLAIAGVFFVLPSLAFALFLPAPELGSEASQDQALAAMQAYYVSALPVLLPVALVQAAGTLAMLALFTDRSRPTVGQAIGQGLGGILPYIAAQLLVGVGVGLGGGLLVTVAALTGVQALAGVAVALVICAAIYVAVRTSLIAPIVVVERLRNPVAALQRSWRLTHGNTARIGLFVALLLLALIVVTSVMMMVLGLILAAVGGDETVKIGTAVISSMLGAVMTLYVVAALAAVHRQLAGPSPEVMRQPFE